MQGPRPTSPPDAREAASIFGLGDVTGEVRLSARGELGRIWRLPTTTGPWALKEVFSTDPSGPADALADVAFQEVALAGGIPMPRPLVAPDGRALVEVGPAGDRRWVRLYSWVDLRPGATPPVDVVARILGRMHAIAPADERPIHPWFRVPPADDELEALLARGRAAGAAWAGAMAGLLPILSAGLAAVGRLAAEPAGRVTCHLDYNPENVLVDMAGGVCVVDWENSGPALLEQELGASLAFFTNEPGSVAAFLRAYADGGGPARLRDRTSFALSETVDANLVAAYARRALDAPDPEDRERAAYWIGDIAAHAFTLERIDAWLAAARSAGLA